MEKYSRTFKGETIRDFTERLRDLDLGGELLHSVRIGLEAVTGITKIVAGEAERISNKMGDKDYQKELAAIRKSVHDLLDLGISIGSLSALTVTKAGRGLAEKMKKENASGGSGHDSPKVVSVARGESTKMPFSVENDSDENIGKITFNSTSLVDENGNEISAGNVTFEPEELAVGPRDFEKQKVVVTVPTDTVPGRYRGIVRMKDNETFELPFIIEVI